MASTEKKTKEDHSKKFKQDTNLLFCVGTYSDVSSFPVCSIYLFVLYNSIQ